MSAKGRFEPSIILVETSACCPPVLQSGRSVFGQLQSFDSARPRVREGSEAEAQWRADELAQATREAARKRSAADNVHLIKSLVAIAAEADPTARSTAPAALAPELRRVLSAG
jgi:hypothetical protein